MMIDKQITTRVLLLLRFYLMKDGIKIFKMKKMFFLLLLLLLSIFFFLLLSFLLSFNIIIFYFQSSFRGR